MAASLRRSWGIRLAIVLAVVAEALHVLWVVLPIHAGGSFGWRSLIDPKGTPTLIWSSAIVVLIGSIALTVAAIVLMRRQGRGRSIAVGVLLALGVETLLSAFSTLMFNLEYVRTFGHVIDLGSGAMWFGLALSLTSAAAFVLAGVVATTADRTTSVPEQPVSTGTQP